MQKKHTGFSFLFDSVKPFKFYLSLHLFVILFNAVDTSLWPYVSKLLIDKLATVPKENLIEEIWPIATLLIILTLLPGLIWRLCDYSWAKMTPLMKKKITSETLSYVMQHSHTFFQNNFSGSLANKIRDLFNYAPKLVETILYNFLSVFLSLIIAFFALYSIHKAFAFGLIFWAILFVLMAVRSAKLTNRMSINIARQQTKIMGNIVDILGNISNVRLFANSEFEKKRIDVFQDKYTRLFERRGFFLVKFYTLHGLSFVAYFVACIVFLIHLYVQGKVTLGDFMMLFTINNYIIHLMWMSANALRTFLEDLGSVNQALKILNTPLQIEDGSADLKISKGEIKFDDVDFAYEEDKAIFKDKSLTIKPGQKVGLVGHSGSGKSTFINLIMRLYDIKSGKITIDDQDISQVTKDSLRRAIGVIPQDPSLFHRTLYENISYGEPKPLPRSKAIPEIIEAAKKAHSHNFIENLPNGYSSLVGERGIKLSGGQRQRISIARAFLKNAPILILDEATSQLDSITETIIQESLQNLMEDKTTLVIAHRLSTLKIMDRILVFKNGEIVEDGTHDELIAKSGNYKKLWDTQVGGVLTNQVENAEAVLAFGNLNEDK